MAGEPLGKTQGSAVDAGDAKEQNPAVKLNLVKWVWLPLLSGLPKLTQTQFTFLAKSGSIKITGFGGSPNFIQS
jgi:hypothetical protein